MREPTDNVSPRRSLLMRLLVRSREYRHPQVWLAIRLIAGLWNLFLGGVILSYGYWIGLLPLAGSALIFWAAFGIYATVQN